MKNIIQGAGLLVFLSLVFKVHCQDLTVKNTPATQPAEITVAGSNGAAGIAIDDEDYPAVKLAAGFFAEDVQRVTGQTPKVGSLNSPAPQMIIAGTIGKSNVIDRLIADGKIQSIDKIKGHWEASLWQIVDNPVKGVKKALVIVGSDRRGTVYGLLQLSRKIGVSPWYWWADAPVKKKQTITIAVPKATWDEPAVKYRGIFINDEDWGMNQWARKTFEKDLGSIGPKTYAKVFELMLRLRLNYIWPAMHGVTKEFGSIPENWQLADRYGIVVGSSHCEPMLYNNVHWNEKTRGHWNYSTNRDTIFNVWKATTNERKNTEAVWTMGIRGIHDRGMETPPTGISDKINLVEQVFKDQRSLIDQYVTKQFGPVAQCFVPYKEVLPVYDAGLKVPGDVTLIWVDDNFGYIRRFSNPDERKRPGGSGVYWHLSYYGGPHSYTWINTTPPALIWEELHKAWENDARKMWVINVGDIKPMELGIDYFSRLAWNPEAQHADAQPLFLRSFLTEHFGADVNAPLAKLLTAYYRLGTIRKPELMNRNWAVSLSDQDAGQLQSEYEHLLQEENTIAKKIPVNEKDAYTEMIGFPARVLAATGLIFMHDRAAVYGNKPQTQQAIIDSLRSFLENQVYDYNNKIADGKWKYMMPGTVTGKDLPAWSSQVAWPWGETAKPDTSKKMIQPDIVRAAASFNSRSGTGKAKWVNVPGLGNSGNAVALEPVSLKAAWQPADPSAPELEYNFKAGARPLKVMIDFLPTFRIYPGMQLRVAVGIDGKLIETVEVPGSNGKEDENGPSRNQGIRNNYVRAAIDLPDLAPGNHKLFIRAVDPGVVVDRILFTSQLP